LKRFKKVPPAVFRASVHVIGKLRSSDSLQGSGLDVQKMEGQRKGEKYYRIRIADYRIGLENVHPKIIVLVIVKRQSI
jgi:mRNA-degrading endonuclease RelE of RelBE toxin-antitoxin system